MDDDLSDIVPFEEGQYSIGYVSYLRKSIKPEWSLTWEDLTKADLYEKLPIFYEKKPSVRLDRFWRCTLQFDHLREAFYIFLRKEPGDLLDKVNQNRKSPVHLRANFKEMIESLLVEMRQLRNNLRDGNFITLTKFQKTVLNSGTKNFEIRVIERRRESALRILLCNPKPTINPATERVKVFKSGPRAEMEPSTFYKFVDYVDHCLSHEYMKMLDHVMTLVNEQYHP